MQPPAIYQLLMATVGRPEWLLPLCLLQRGVGAGVAVGMAMGVAVAAVRALCPMSPVSCVSEAASCAALNPRVAGQDLFPGLSLCCSGPWPHTAAFANCSCREGMGKS